MEFRPPKRLTLQAQVTSSLRRQIESGAWDREVPSERWLSDHLQVSRPTVRAALASLRQEGLIRTAERSRSQVVRRKRSKAKQPPATINLLTVERLEGLYGIEHLIIAELRRRLHSAGLSIEVLGDRRLRQAKPGAVLDRLTAQFPAGGWILAHQTRPVQKWFAEKGVPAVIWGTAHTGVQLASFDIHNQAACRHCVGLFSRMGHRDIALIVRQSGSAGDLASEAGWEEGVEALRSTSRQALILRHNGTVPDMCKALDRAFNGLHPPTALLASGSHEALTVISYLAQRRLRMPEDVSLVSLISDTILDAVVPTVARYHTDFADYAARLSRGILQLAQTGHVRPRPHLMIPTFQDGGTLAAPATR